MNDQDRAAQVLSTFPLFVFKLFTQDERQDAISTIAAYGKEQFRAGVDKFQEWSDVAFYPGPNENPHFQLGYMEAVHEVGRIAYRLLAEQEKT